MKVWSARNELDPVIEQTAKLIKERSLQQISALDGKWTDVARILDDAGLLYRPDADGYARVRREARAEVFNELADEFGVRGSHGSLAGRHMYTVFELRRWFLQLAKREVKP